MDENKPRRRKTVMLFVATVAVATIVAVGGVALLINIVEHKQEAKNPFFRVVEPDDNTVDPAVWGKNFPLQPKAIHYGMSRLVAVSFEDLKDVLVLPDGGFLAGGRAASVDGHLAGLNHGNEDAWVIRLDPQG